MKIIILPILILLVIMILAQARTQHNFNPYNQVIVNNYYNGQIKTEEINGIVVYTAKCEHCNKIFSYNYKAQTENNVISHMNYCKYKPRNAQIPTIEQPTENNDYQKYKTFYEKYHKIIEQFQKEGIVP